MRSKYTDEQFIQAVNSSNNIRQVCKKLNIAAYGSNYEVVKNKIKQLELDTNHFGTIPMHRPVHKSFHLDQILVQGSFYKNTTNLKQRLIKAEYLKEQCHNCHRDNYEINGQLIKMPLELHHIDGDRRNNSLNNLVLLCPICHTLTKTYRRRKQQKVLPFHCSSCGKQIRNNKYGLCRNCYIKRKRGLSDSVGFIQEQKICKNCGCILAKHTKTGLCIKCYHLSTRNPNRPSKAVLLQQIQTHSFLKLGEKYGVSDNTVRKWCKDYGIDLSCATGGRKRSLQGLKQGRETQSELKKLKQTCPICGRKKNGSSQVCRFCYLEKQREITKQNYHQKT